MALDLQLPGTVEGGDPALGTGERADVGGAKVRNTPGVAIRPVCPVAQTVPLSMPLSTADFPHLSIPPVI